MNEWMSVRPIVSSSSSSSSPFNHHLYHHHHPPPHYYHHNYHHDHHHHLVIIIIIVITIIIIVIIIITIIIILLSPSSSSHHHHRMNVRCLPWNMSPVHSGSTYPSWSSDLWRITIIVLSAAYTLLTMLWYHSVLSSLNVTYLIWGLSTSSPTLLSIILSEYW